MGLVFPRNTTVGYSLFVRTGIVPTTMSDTSSIIDLGTYLKLGGFIKKIIKEYS